MIRLPSLMKKKARVRTVTSCTAAEKTPTVTDVRAPVMSPRRFGSFFASTLSFWVTWYLLSYLRSVLLLRMSCT